MAVIYWEGGNQLISYNSGSDEPTIGDVLGGITSLATGVAVSWTLVSGSWAGNDAAGVFTLTDVTGTWQNAETIENQTQSDVDIASTASTLTDNSEDWATDKNWSGDVAPTNDDFIIFDSRGHAITGTIYDVSDGMAQGEIGGTTPDLLHVKKGYTGDLGLVTEPLHLLPDKFIYEGSGTCYFESSMGDAVSDGEVVDVTMDSASGTLYLDSNVNSGSWVQFFGDVRAVKGTLNIGANNPTWIRRLWMVGSNGVSSNIIVAIGIDCERTKATAATMTIYQRSGVLTTDSDIASMFLFGGTLNVGTDLGLAPEVGNTIIQLEMHEGQLNWYPDATSTVTIATAFIFGGTFEASGALNADRPKTLGTVELFSGATMNLNNGKGNITIDTQLLNHGGEVNLDKNADISWTYDTI